MQIKFKFKEFEIFLWEIRPTIERPGLESQRSRERLFFHRKISNSLNLNYYYYIILKKLYDNNIFKLFQII